ncbi:MAG: hypothetical protein KKE51_04065 [Gammaproteobacteria bacterium]|nr:hypothetical protein [Gammaproteobacteria bacterium]MBU1603566.1 hypothetical protein [Gammaproteobacteria bacterium]MBU2432363.1 hypothetical protein [Gammaproteobacteria bacterium]MBU2447705.1 hypothetical protein [Gammaproteobacteria bacterium]
MRILLVVLVSLTLPAQAAEPALRPSATLLFKQPELLRTGQCVRYEEGGDGWVVTDPVFFLKGEVLAAEVRTRHLGKCPVVPGKTLEHYSRDEFNRHAQAFPCVAEGVAERDEQSGVVRVRVADWETPYAKKAENAGRLYRGMFIERKLEKGMEIELEADLLRVCDQ